MKPKTKIEWADRTWNPYTWSCNKVSPGCKHCYMMSFANRLNKPSPVGAPSVRESAWQELKRIPDGDVVFVNSMSDTYHEGVPYETILRVHDAIVAHPTITFLLLTKRIERAYELHKNLPMPDNLWIGTSVESQDYAWRLAVLHEIKAAGRFVSAEPLLGPLDIAPHLDYLDWVIVGGESGKHYRPFDKEWARSIRDACIIHDVPFMFKQGAAFKSGQDRLLDGRTWDETPFHAPDVVQKPYQRSLL